jgi:hypothetical protein
MLLFIVLSTIKATPASYAPFSCPLYKTVCDLVSNIPFPSYIAVTVSWYCWIWCSSDLSGPALYNVLTFHVPDSVSMFRCPNRLSCFRPFWGICWGSVTIMFYGVRLLASWPTPVNFGGTFDFLLGFTPLAIGSSFKGLETRPPSHSHLLHNPLFIAPGPPRGGWEFVFAGGACRCQNGLGWQ